MNNGVLKGEVGDYWMEIAKKKKEYLEFVIPDAKKCWTRLMMMIGLKSDCK